MTNQEITDAISALTLVIEANKLKFKNAETEGVAVIQWMGHDIEYKSGQKIIECANSKIFELINRYK